MTMQLRIVHTTQFEYEGGKATASYNQARLTPQTTASQIVLHTRVDVSPTPYTYSYRDYFGATVTAFEVFDPHDALTVVGTSTVQTSRTPSPGPQLTWPQLRAPEVADTYCEFLVTPPTVEPPPDLADRVRAIEAAAELPGDAAAAMCALVHDEVDYITGSTSVMTVAAEAWLQRAGVCQDMVHLCIGGLRMMGIPARYVSGYQHPIDEPVIGETIKGESHAWVEWWDAGWHGWDPVNAIEPNDRHVVVATGRDYVDVKPLNGIYSGNVTSRMSVDVSITALSNSAVSRS